MPRVHLRAATLADAGAIAALHIASWRTAYRGALPDAYLDALDLDEQTRAWHDRLVDPAKSVLVAIEDDAIVGFCAVAPSPDADADASVWFIANLHVAPDRRRQGIGAPLFDAAADLARRAGARRLTLWVIETNEPARRFYEKNGMALDGARDRRDFDVDLVRYAQILEAS